MLGVPVFLCLSTWALLASLLIDFSIQNISMTCYQGISSYMLLALPLFILTGDLIRAGGIAARLSGLAAAFLRPVRGGMTLAMALSSSMYAGICGSNFTAKASNDQIHGSDNDLCSTPTSSYGIVGLVIPPCILMVVYGFITNLSVIDLFTAGWLPGVCVIAGLAGGVFYRCRKYRWGTAAPFASGDAVKALWKAKSAFGAVFLIIVLLYDGFSSLTEAAGVVALYFLFIGTLVTRKIKIKDIPAIFLSSARINGILAPTIAIALVMQQTFSITGMHRIVHDYVYASIQPWSILIAIMGILTFFSCIMQPISICIIFAPIIAPIAVSLGMNPYHFGLVFVVGLSLGFIITASSLDSSETSAEAAKPRWRLIPWLPHYVVGVCIAWIFIAFIPDISLVLLKLIGGAGF
jgi:C4-dicarboxylate transporter, DctM subunit